MCAAVYTNYPCKLKDVEELYEKLENVDIMEEANNKSELFYKIMDRVNQIYYSEDVRVAPSKAYGSVDIFERPP